METLPDELSELRRGVRDLAALTALSAVWNGRAPDQIAESLADALLSILDVEFLYVCVTSSEGQNAIEVARADRPLTEAASQAIGLALAPWLKPDGTSSHTSIPSPITGGEVGLVVTPIGLEAASGFVAAGARQPGFPTSLDQLLLSAGANLAAVALQGAQLLAMTREAARLKDRMLAELDQSRRMFQRIAATSPDLLYVYDLDTGQNLYTSGHSERINGYTDDEVAELGDRFATTLWHPDDASQLPEHRRRLRDLADGDIYETEHRIRQPDGSYYWLRSRTTVFARDTAGQVRQIIGVTQNVTQRKRAEEVLRASEERFRGYFQLGLIGMAITSPVKGILEVNDQICAILGYERAELLRMTWEEITYPDDLAADKAQFDRVTSGEMDGYSLDKRWIRKDGQVIDSTISVRCLRRADGSVDYLLALLQDITERKQAELARVQLAAIVESSDDAIISKNLDGIILSWNAGAEQTYGYTVAEILGRSIDIIFPPERIDELSQILEQIKRGERIQHYETERMRKDGSRLHISLTISPMMDAAGTIVAASTIARDITERKRVEAELLAVKDRLAADLAAMTRLHKLSIQLLATSELQPLLQQALSATIALQGADFGNIQRYDRQTGTLEIIAQQGFDQAFLDYFSVVEHQHAACGRAAIQGQRVIIEDVETDVDFAPHRTVATATGFRTVQSTPLLDRDSELLGMLSTHFRQPHRFTEHELRLTDLYSQQVAEMIGFTLAEQELRQAHEQLEARVVERTLELAETNAALRMEISERARAEQARQQLLGQLVSVQEEERQRISRELHDSLGQHLTALHLGLKAVQEQDGCSLHQAERLQQLRELALRLDDAVDRLSFELRPPALDDLGLEDALRQLVKEWSATSRIPVDMHTIQLGHWRLPVAIETTIYRIVQESLTNILKHAQATHVSLIVERHTGEVRAIIEDNGRGFDLEGVTNTSGARRPFGLTSMAERAALAGGQLDIETAPGAGTTIYMHVPLHPETGGGGKATDE